MATLGVLSLQGAFAKHRTVLEALGATTKLVRYPDDLDAVEGLIIPGGESTTMIKLIDEHGLRDRLLGFALERPIFGTCAGMILMASDMRDSRVKPLGLMDIDVERNAYGRQVDSFTTPLEVRLNGGTAHVRGVFIRAPRLRRVGPGVEVLASVDGEPVLLRQGRHLAAAFHPELSDSTVIHEHFLKSAEGPALPE